MQSELTTSPVEIVDVPERLAAVVRKRVPMSDIPDAQRRARSTLARALEAADMTPLGPTLTVWRMPEGGSMDYAPGVFVTKPLETGGDVSSMTLPAGRAAHLRLSGPYEGLPDAWGRLFRGCAGNDLAGTNWEVYTEQDGPSGPQTDLYALLA